MEETSNINNFDNINNMIHQFIIDKNNIEFISFAKSNMEMLFNSYTQYLSINKSDKDYNEYLNLSKVKIADSMYNTYDYWLKKKYKVDINYQALEEVKNLIK